MHPSSPMHVIVGQLFAHSCSRACSIPNDGIDDVESNLMRKKELRSDREGLTKILLL